MDERLWFLEHRVESTLFRHLENPFSDQTQTKTELCGLYKGRYPPGFTWSYLLSVSSNYHPAICFGMLTTCPLVAIKKILWKRVPFPRNFFQLYLYLWRWPILNYYTMAELQNSWKYKYLYYVILKIKVRLVWKSYTDPLLWLKNKAICCQVKL